MGAPWPSDTRSAPCSRGSRGKCIFKGRVIRFPASALQVWHAGAPSPAVEGSCSRLLIPAEWGSPEGQPRGPGLGETGQGTDVTDASCPGSSWRAPSPLCCLAHHICEQVLDQVFTQGSYSTPPTRPTLKTPGGQTSGQGSPQGSLITASVSFRAHLMQGALRSPETYEGETEAQKRDFPEATR